MANYGGGQRYTRPLPNERSGPRFAPTQNRNVPRPNFTDPRPFLPPCPMKTTSDTPLNTNVSSIRNQTTTNSTDSSIDSSNKSLKTTTTTSELSSTEQTFESPDPKNMNKSDSKHSDENSTNNKRLRTDNHFQVESTDKKPVQGGRCRLFIGNIPSDLTQEEFQLLFGKYGELIEYFVNPSRGFGFIKLSSRYLAEQAKYDLDGYVLRGKSLRIRFASQGATVKVKNLSPNVSNELLKDAFEQYFGIVERAVVVVDDRGKSTGEGIIEFEKKPSAQKCLNECTERCFFLTNELRPVTVEPWDIRDDEDGLPEKTLIRNAAYTKERDGKPRFAELNTIEHDIALKWKQLEIQERDSLEEVKRHMQRATQQIQADIDRMYLEHQSQMLREELLRRQEDLRRIDELRSQEINRRNIPPIHHNDNFNNSYPQSNNYFYQNSLPPNNYPYNEYSQTTAYTNPTPNPLMQSNSPANIDAVYTTNQVVRGYGLGNNNSGRTNPDDFHHQHGFDRKRPRY